MTLDINRVFRSCRIMIRVRKFTTFSQRRNLLNFAFNLFFSASLHTGCGGARKWIPIPRASLITTIKPPAANPISAFPYHFLCRCW
jgi:hypothetical protein